MNPTKLFFYSILLGLTFACSEEPEVDCGPCGVNMNRVEEPETPEEAMVMKKIADTSTAGSVEFQENKRKIEAVYGEQWDFCKCIVLNDSIDKAVKAGHMDDKLMERFDEVDQHCKSFLVMDQSRTPEERIKHEKKVAKCLKNAGVK